MGAPTRWRWRRQSPLTSRLLVATRNAGKLGELRELLADVPYELVSLDDVGVGEDVEETGATFQENAVLKATAYCRLSGLLTLADDSGLEVDALAGEPGVHSARYAGEGATDGDRIALLLRNLRERPTPWTARFRCVIAIASPGLEPQHGGSESVRTFDGRCEGEIVGEPRGDNGFGYDPVFFIPGVDKTMAELTEEGKNGISHRSAAAALASDALLHGWVDQPP